MENVSTKHYVWEYFSYLKGYDRIFNEFFNLFLKKCYLPVNLIIAGTWMAFLTNSGTSYTCESQCESAKLCIRHLEFVRGAEVQRFSSFFGLSWNIIVTFFRLFPECRWLWRLYGGMCDSFILFILEDRGPDLIIHVIFDLDPISNRKIQAGYDKVVRSRSFKIWSKFGGPGMNVQIDECHMSSPGWKNMLAEYPTTSGYLEATAKTSRGGFWPRSPIEPERRATILSTCSWIAHCLKWLCSICWHRYHWSIIF